MRHPLLVVALSALGACQCLEPVDERMDGGSRSDGGALQDGGPDAGAPGDAGAAVDAGEDAGATADAGRDAGVFDGGAACTTAADCPGAGTPFQFCGGLVPACVNQRCLFECPRFDAGPQTCLSATPECLSCGLGPRCSRCDARACSFQVDPVVGACPAPFDDGDFHRVQPFSGRCGGGIVKDGGVVGVWVGSIEDGRALLEIPALGGTCLGSPLATQVPRTFISCPACSFVATGCE